MPVQVDIKFDKHKLADIRRRLSEVPKAAPGVMSRAINRTATTIRAALVKRLMGTVKLRAKTIRSHIKISKATRRRLKAVISIFGRRIPLIDYRGARQIKKGVSFTISTSVSSVITTRGGDVIARVGAGRQRITGPPAPFITTVRGHRGIFRRKTAETKRLPIVELYGPGLGEIYAQLDPQARRMNAEATNALRKNIESQIDYVLSKHGLK